MAIERIGEIGSGTKVNINNDAVKVSNNATPAPVKEQPIVIEGGKASDSNEGGNGQREASSEQLKKAVSRINRKMVNTSCQFGIHDATNRVMIKLVDNETKEVIKEYPAEETLDIIAKAWELAGILVDKKL